MTATHIKTDDAFGFLKTKEDQQKIIETMLFLKVNNLENQLQNLEERLIRNEQESVFLWEIEKDAYDPIENRKKTFRKIDKSISQNADNWQECQKIVERALEILHDWENTDDIKMQVQYASVIIGKIDNLKKREVVSCDEARNKVCTLLRNVIRLNFSEDVFSKEQIALLEEGFSLIVERDLQKESLFLLNRKLRKEGLLTMPAWE